MPSLYFVLREFGYIFDSTRKVWIFSIPFVNFIRGIYFEYPSSVYVFTLGYDYSKKVFHLFSNSTW